MLIAQKMPLKTIAPRLKSTSFQIVLIGALAACATPAEQVKIEDDGPGVRISLQEALRRADEQKMRTEAAQSSANLSASVMSSVNWKGEGADILSRIAAAQQMKFKITGPQPRLALPVFIELRNVTLKEALQVIAEQFGQRADVVLFDDIIELRMKLY